MADSKITDLGSLGAIETGDVFAIADINDNTQAASGTTKKVTIDTLEAYLNSNLSFLTTETDPVFTASPAGGIVAGDITNWNTAYGWGDHSTQGYVTNDTNFANTDLTFTANRTHTLGGNTLDLVGSGAVVSALTLLDLVGSGAVVSALTLENTNIGARTWFNASSDVGDIFVRAHGSNSPQDTIYQGTGMIATGSMPLQNVIAAVTGTAWQVITDTNLLLSNPSVRMEMNSSGEFGFGTTPIASTRMAIGGNVQADGTLFVNNSGTHTIGTGTGSPILELDGSTNPTLRLKDDTITKVDLSVDNGNGGLLNLYDSTGVLKTKISQGASAFQNRVVVGAASSFASINLAVIGQGTTSATNAFLCYDSTGSTELLRVRDDGNIGIGVGAPSAKLHVGGDSLIEGNLGINELISTTSLNIKASVTDTKYLEMKDSASTTVFQYNTTGFLRWDTIATSRIGFGVASAAGSTLRLDGNAIALDSLNGGTTTFRVRQSGQTSIGGAFASTANLMIAGGTTAGASLQVRTGVRPTSPFAGDIIFDGTNLEYYNGTSWVTL
jgi:hypothetical protein